ncbi:MAG: PqiC family protein [Cocleimonas sp.]
MKKISLILLLLSSLSACSSVLNTPDSALGGTHFYSLVALAPVSTANKNQQRFGIGPVEIPRLLNRPQIISRKDNTEILMAEKHQWGGSYKEELTQALIDNLSKLLNTDNIEQYPWKFSFKPAYSVRIDIERFDGQLGKAVTLKARWRLFKGEKEVLVKRSVITVAIKGRGYTAYVKAQSRALAQLSETIASKITHE